MKTTKNRIRTWLWNKFYSIINTIEEKFLYMPDLEALAERVFIWCLCTGGASGIFAIPIFFVLYFYPKLWILILAVSSSIGIGTIVYLILWTQYNDGFGLFDSAKRFKLIRYSWIGRPNLWIDVDEDDGTPEFENLAKSTRHKWYTKLKSIEEPPEYEKDNTERFKSLGV